MIVMQIPTINKATVWIAHVPNVILTDNGEIEIMEDGESKLNFDYN